MSAALSKEMQSALLRQDLIVRIVLTTVLCCLLTKKEIELIYALPQMNRSERV
ncbi:hypothetical protein PsAD37_01932 [Pseudovibrio sp. Ad37]|nr:hypothetical protein PsAD37_01932 [Pseudovibrio sp. Ad37]